MKYRSMVGVLLFVALANVAAAIPSHPTGYTIDWANVMTPETRQNLETILANYEKATTIEVAVVTVPGLEGMTVEEYAGKIFHAWGIGKKGKDNGILLLVAPNDHRVRVEVGYGMEPDLTDLQSKEIIDVMTPLFKENKFSEGITAGVSKMLATLGNKPFQQRQEERAAAAVAQQRQQKLETEQVKSVLMIIGMLVLAGGVFAGLLMGFFAIRRHLQEFRDLQKENRKIIATLDASIDATTKAYRTATEKVDRLKTKHPPSAWNNLRVPGQISSLHTDLSQIIGKEPARTLAQARITQHNLQELQDEINRYNDFVRRVEKRIADIAEAQKNSPLLAAHEQELLRSTEHSAQDADVTEKTQQMVRTLRKQFQAAYALGAQTPCDHLGFYSQLQQIMAELTAANTAIENDKTYAITARREGPNLLKSIPELFTGAAREVSLSGLTPARERFEKAQKSFSGTSVDWVVAFAELSAIVALIQAAISRARSDKEEEERRERHRREESSRSSYSSSSYDSGSSSSSSFGGFGGGDSGGGGASGNW